MDIQVGEYVRNREGIIFKVDEEKKNIQINEFMNMRGSKDILKHSKNIIDLIEVGDVIRYKIKNISTTLETKGFIEGIVDISDEEQLENMKKDKNYEIKTIVTKEQFKSVEYEVN